jgi:hypothetical protein
MMALSEGPVIPLLLLWLVEECQRPSDRQLSSLPLLHGVSLGHGGHRAGKDLVKMTTSKGGLVNVLQYN